MDRHGAELAELADPIRPYTFPAPLDTGRNDGDGFRSTPDEPFRLETVGQWSPALREGQGAVPICSAHYFQLGDGIAAFSWYGQGTRFSDPRCSPPSSTLPARGRRSPGWDPTRCTAGRAACLRESRHEIAAPRPAKPGG